MQARIKAMEGQAVTSARFYLWREYLELCKPRVVALMVFTSLVGMFLATPDFVPVEALVFGTIGIGFMAGTAAAINHLVDQRIDGLMRRTMGRPLPTGRVDPISALIFVLALGGIGLAILAVLVNQLTALLTLLSLVGYSGVYTLYLKRATPQNIVIGGAAGAMPPVLGWTAVTGQIDPHALLLFLIIFAWTPPHFWALAIHRRNEYARAGVPMLPVTHGVAFTRLQILLYTLILVVVSVLPFVTRMSGWLYLGGTLILNAGFLYHAIALWLRDDAKLPMKTFGYSIVYLMALFAFLLLDHYLLI
nr:heme o synthase [Gammaproteobacteria bacterium]